MDIELLPNRTSTNWSLCCLCQKETSEKLNQPYTKQHLHKAYETLGQDIQFYIDNDIQLPFLPGKECLLEDEDSLSSSLLNHKATFHKSCRDKIRKLYAKRQLNKRKSDDTPSTSSPKKTRKSLSVGYDRQRPQCVVCDKYQDETGEKMHQAQTQVVGEKLKDMAKSTNNWKVFSRLNDAFDATAGDIYYHTLCYMQLSNRARTVKLQDQAPCGTPHALPYDPLVLAEIVSFVQMQGNVVKLSDIKKLYTQRLHNVNSDWKNMALNSTRFKEHILKRLGDGWHAYNKGKEVFISSNSTTGSVLMESVQQRLTEDEETQIVEVSLLVRKHILESQVPFTGTFTTNCLSEPVPNILLTLLQVLLDGSTMNTSDDHETSNARTRVACTISNLVITNSLKRASKSSTKTLQQSRHRETAFPLYTGLKLHACARLKGIIKHFHQLGVSVSYERVMEVRKRLAQAASKRFKENGVVVPTNCQRNVFTTATVDNIDVSGRHDMHGTSITLIMHKNKDSSGTPPAPLSLDISESTPVELPEEFSTVPYVQEEGVDLSLQRLDETDPLNVCNVTHSSVEVEENDWLQHIRDIVYNGKKDGKWTLGKIPVTFSGFFSKHQNSDDVNPPAVIGLFPLFSDEKADSLSMQKHAMTVVKKAIEFVNPGQTPIIEGDCPLYARLKRCQILFPSEVGEHHFVCMIGFLHLEMCLQEVGGKIIGGSGWEQMFHKAGLFSSGVAASLLGGKHIKRTRSAYLLTLAWLEVMKHLCYDEYCKVFGPHEMIQAWEERLFSHPTIRYWGKTVKDFLQKMCVFLRCQRLGDWCGTLNAIESLCPYIFAFGQTNYSRWLPVFLRDMRRLPLLHPEVHENFIKGHFVVQRSNTKFSLVGLDQSQEHSIKMLKEDCGSKGLYDQPDGKLLIELSRPEVIRIIEEFEVDSSMTNCQQHTAQHPDSSTAQQNIFLNNLQSLINVVRDGIILNPYEETTFYLRTLDTGEYVDPEVAKSLNMIYEKGQDLYNTFYNDRIKECTVPLSDVISKPTTFTFLHPPPANLEKSKTKSSSNKSSTAIITQMFVSLQARPESNIEDFFKHENAKEPPSLAFKGKLRSGTKSQIIECLPGGAFRGSNPLTKQATVVIFDMPAIVHMIRPNRANSFEEYADLQLLPYIESEVNQASRVDAIWDQYKEGSLKNQTRMKRLGETASKRRVVAKRLPIPKGKHWDDFLKVSENKYELFPFLADELVRKTRQSPYLFVTTKKEDVLTNKFIDVSSIKNTDQDEADTRIILHLGHAVENGHKVAYVRTVDSDIVILCIHFFPKHHGLLELWVGYGKGKYFSALPIHQICQQLSPKMCEAILFSMHLQVAILHQV